MIRDAGPARPVTRWRRVLAMSCDWVSVYFLGLVLTTPVAVGVYLAGYALLGAALLRGARLQRPRGGAPLGVDGHERVQRCERCHHDRASVAANPTQR